tara:strand:- start:1106 stop:1276 length:171 start_codon:yes stop_codon:yes gene_type:complete
MTKQTIHRLAQDITIISRQTGVTNEQAAKQIDGRMDGTQPADWMQIVLEYINQNNM